MPQEQVLSVAIFHIVEGRETECLRVLGELHDLLKRKNYSRDLLLRDAKRPQRIVNVRFWMSEQTRIEAAEDPEVHRCWLRLPELLEMELVLERLDAIPGFPSQKEELFS